MPNRQIYIQCHQPFVLRYLPPSSYFFSGSEGDDKQLLYQLVVFQHSLLEHRSIQVGANSIMLVQKRVVVFKKANRSHRTCPPCKNDKKSTKCIHSLKNSINMERN